MYMMIVLKKIQQHIIQNKKFYLFLIFFYIFIFISLLALGARNFFINTTFYNFLFVGYLTIPVVAFFLLIRSLSKVLFNIALLVWFILSWLYLPQAMIYGQLNYGMLVSFFETNQNETIEYLLGFSWYVYLFLMGYFLIYVILFHFSRKIELVYFRVYRLLCVIIFVTFFFINPVLSYIKNNNFIISYSKSHIYPIYLVASIKRDVNIYLDVVNHIEAGLHEPNTWRIKSISPKYKIYVLIIGESVRREYMGMYNYPVNNTPFLNQVKGIVFNNYISSAAHTQTSLARTLYFTESIDKNIIYTNHILNLFNNNSFESYWLSNQGKLGYHDSMATRVSQKANQSLFLNKTASKQSFDSKLKPHIQNAINDKTEKHKFIVVHLMGSHSDFCQRIEGEPSYKLINHKMSCYFESILQTDRLIEDIYHMLQKSGESFSVMYFADHGLSQKKGHDGLFHNPQYKQSYHVPLIQFSSDDTKRTYIDAYKSGFDLIYGIAEWVGIEEETLSKKPSFYSNDTTERVKVFNTKELVYYDELEDDPTLPPIPYK